MQTRSTELRFAPSPVTFCTLFYLRRPGRFKFAHCESALGARLAVREMPGVRIGVTSQITLPAFSRRSQAIAVLRATCEAFFRRERRHGSCWCRALS